MTTRTVALEAEIATASTSLALGAQSVVALPPSSFDAGVGYGSYSSGYTPTIVATGDMRVDINGSRIRRRYDSDVNQ